MPAPDPDAVWLEVNKYGRLAVSYYGAFWDRNSKSRKRRAVAMLKRAAKGNWICLWCGGELPYFKRVDARYCCEGCRKRRARWRKDK